MSVSALVPRAPVSTGQYPHVQYSDKGGNPESREPESSVTGTKFVCPLLLRQYLYLPRLFAI